MCVRVDVLSLDYLDGVAPLVSLDCVSFDGSVRVSVLAVDAFDAAVRAERITGVWMIAE